MTEILKKFYHASNLVKQKKYDVALAEFLKIVKAKPDFREAFMYIGSIYSILDKNDQSEKWFLQAQKIKNDHLIMYNLGSLYYKSGKYKKAILILEKAKKYDKNFVSADLIMGLSFSRLNNFKAAESNFKKVIELDAKNRIALTALAILYYNDNQNNESLKLFKLLVKLYPESTKFDNITNTLMQRTDSSKDEKQQKVIGKKIYDEFIKSVPVEMFTDKYGTLDEKISNLKNKKNNDSESLLSLSLCHLFNGEPEEAMKYLKKAKDKI